MINLYVRLTLKSLFSLPIYVKVSNISNSSLKIVMQASQGSPVFQFLCILENQLSKGTLQTRLLMTDLQFFAPTRLDFITYIFCI